MYTRPTAVADEAVREALRARWGFDAVSITYEPMGFGSDHWRATLHRLQHRKSESLVKRWKHKGVAQRVERHQIGFRDVPRHEDISIVQPKPASTRGQRTTSFLRHCADDDQLHVALCFRRYFAESGQRAYVRNEPVIA